jgi:hypothetical protein
MLKKEGRRCSPEVWAQGADSTKGKQRHSYSTTMTALPPMVLTTGEAWQQVSAGFNHFCFSAEIETLTAMMERDAQEVYGSRQASAWFPARASLTRQKGKAWSTNASMACPFGELIALSIAREGPDPMLRTLYGAAILIASLDPFRQARAVWDHCAGELMKAMETGKDADIKEATRCLRVALNQENWWKR